MNVQSKVSRRIIAIAILFVFAAIPAVGQSKSNYQVATIMEVVVHHAGGAPASNSVSYDVSLKVGDTIYVTLYTPPLSESTVKYAAGRNLLVLVEKKTITYNDILGRSFEVPILTQRLVSEATPSK